MIIITDRLLDCDHHMGEADGYEDLQPVLQLYFTEYEYRRLVNISSLPRTPMPCSCGKATTGRLGSFGQESLLTEDDYLILLT